MKGRKGTRPFEDTFNFLLHTMGLSLPRLAGYSVFNSRVTCHSVTYMYQVGRVSEVSCVKRIKLTGDLLTPGKLNIALAGTVGDRILLPVTGGRYTNIAVRDVVGKCNSIT